VFPVLPPAPEEEEEPRGTEMDAITGWRFGYLLGAGYDPEAALLIAKDNGVDLHRAADLVKNGCAPDTALRILL
jgi:hypothetical protein